MEHFAVAAFLWRVNTLPIWVPQLHPTTLSTLNWSTVVASSFLDRPSLTQVWIIFYFNYYSFIILTLIIIIITPLHHKFSYLFILGEPIRNSLNFSLWFCILSMQMINIECEKTQLFRKVNKLFQGSFKSQTSSTYVIIRAVLSLYLIMYIN